MCLYSFHPLLVSEFARLLPESAFRFVFHRLTVEQASELESAAIPRAAVFVVEGHARGEVTQMVVNAVLASRSGTRVLVIGEGFDENYAFPLLRLGVKGLLTYSEVPDQLARAIGVVASSGFWVPRKLLSRFVETTVAGTKRPKSLPIARRLSPRERQVLELLLQNLSNKEVAKELHISSRTAKFHVSNLLAKHGVRRRADLIVLAHTQPSGE